MEQQNVSRLAGSQPQPHRTLSASFPDSGNGVFWWLLATLPHLYHGEILRAVDSLRQYHHSAITIHLHSNFIETVAVPVSGCSMRIDSSERPALALPRRTARMRAPQLPESPFVTPRRNSSSHFPLPYSGLSMPNLSGVCTTVSRTPLGVSLNCPRGRITHGTP
ncbi:hypothetical protein BDV96DRAFT_704 [Lophiotrema nucula]|uniref:Uncharacterized protein n=1 Tax=Lophiotrema nucula TaxID=690887 RepID=A0A6A5ZUE8_9PLEO|nr:hypothetical protein BDV96DRAFT_704 [Lophiotrema nucula]